MLEFPCCVTWLCENGSSITILAWVDQINSFLKSVSSNKAENGAEDFFIIGSCSWLAVVNNCCPNEVSFLKPLNRDSSTIQKNFVFFRGLLNDAFNFFLRLLADERSNVNVLCAWAYRQLLAFLNNFRNPLLTFPDHNTYWDSHASLSCGPEASTNQSVDSIFLVSIWQNDGVVLSAHVALASFSVMAGCAIDILSCLVSSYEGDGSNIRMSANICDCLCSSLYHVQYSVRNACLLEQVYQNVGGSGHFFRRLHHISVSESDC